MQLDRYFEHGATAGACFLSADSESSSSTSAISAQVGLLGCEWLQDAAGSARHSQAVSFSLLCNFAHVSVRRPSNAPRAVSMKAPPGPLQPDGPESLTSEPFIITSGEKCLQPWS